MHAERAFAIGERARAALTGAAFAAFAAAFAPHAHDADGATVPHAHGPSLAPRALRPDASVVALRDPFAAPPRSRASSAADDAPRTVAVLPALPLLPPNAGAPPSPFSLGPPSATTVVPAGAPPATPAPTVAALVSGGDGLALIVVDGATRIVRARDRVGTRTIARIDAHGVLLDDGTTLRAPAVRAIGGP